MLYIGCYPVLDISLANLVINLPPEVQGPSDFGPQVIRTIKVTVKLVQNEYISIIHNFKAQLQIPTGDYRLSNDFKIRILAVQDRMFLYNPQGYS